MLQTSTGRSQATVAIILLAIAMTGCIVPVTTRIKGPGDIRQFRFVHRRKARALEAPKRTKSFTH